MNVKMNSQHGKNLPKIRETIADLQRQKIRETFLSCVSEEHFLGVASEKDGPDRSARHLVLVKKDEIVVPKPDFSYAKLLVDRILDENTPTFELRAGMVKTVFMEMEAHLGQAKIKMWREIAVELEFALSARGYTSEDIKTPFEHALSGSYSGGLKLDVPVGVQKRNITIREANVARELCLVEHGHGEFFTLQGANLTHVSYYLFPLDSRGMVSMRPIAVNREKLGNSLKELPTDRAVMECIISNVGLNTKAVEAAIAKKKLLTADPIQSHNIRILSRGPQSS